MRCKNCLRTYKTRGKKTICWSKWQLCGQCAVQLHPEEYSDSKIRCWTPIYNAKETPRLSKAYANILKKKPRMYTHCLHCNSSLEGKHYNTKYCSDQCKLDIYTDKHCKEKRISYHKAWYIRKRAKVLEMNKTKLCKLCSRNIYEVDPNKKQYRDFCGSKCRQLSNHLKNRGLKPKEYSTRINLQVYLDLLKDGHIEQ